VEGPTIDPDVEALRLRQIKNFLTVTTLSIGVPMILMGDEIRRTQGGNNNAYCHDSDLNWFDWSQVEKQADLLRFTQLLFERRTLRDTEHERRRVSLTQLIASSNHAWHGVRLNQPDWGDQSHSIAFLVELKQEKLLVYFIFNAYREPLDFELPPADNGWQRWIDTSRPSPDDIVDWTQTPPVAGNTYPAAAHSVIVLCARMDGANGSAKPSP
jgi:glycogen operon protein